MKKNKEKRERMDEEFDDKRVHVQNNITCKTVSYLSWHSSQIIRADGKEKKSPERSARVTAGDIRERGGMEMLTRSVGNMVHGLAKIGARTRDKLRPSRRQSS